MRMSIAVSTNDAKNMINIAKCCLHRLMSLTRIAALQQGYEPHRRNRKLRWRSSVGRAADL